MKKILNTVHHFFSKTHAHTRQRVDTDILANLELALAFNNAIDLEFKHKTGSIISFTATVINITERQVVVKDLNSQQIRIILLTKIKNVSFMHEHKDRTPIEKQNA